MKLSVISNCRRDRTVVHQMQITRTCVKFLTGKSNRQQSTKSGYILTSQSRSRVRISKVLCRRCCTKQHIRLVHCPLILSCRVMNRPSTIKLPKLPGFNQHSCSHSFISYILRQLQQHYNAQNDNATTFFLECCCL